MVMLNMCRICLVENVRMKAVHTKLQEIYERLTTLPFVRMDGRPMQVCFICYARLRNCQVLQIRCIQSEELFTQMISNNKLIPKPIHAMNSLKIEHSTINWSIIDTNQVHDNDPKMDHISIDMKVDPLGVIEQMKLKDEHIEALEDDLYQELGLESGGPSANFDIKYGNDRINDNDEVVSSLQTTEEKHKLSLETSEICIQDTKEKVPPLLSSDAIINLGSNDITDSDIPSAGLKDYVLPVDIRLAKKSSGPRVRKKPKLCARNRKHSKDIKLIKNKNTIKELNADEKVCDSIKPEKRYICDVCGKCCNRKNNLIKHTRVHTGERPYKCNICGKCVTTKPILNNHIRIIHRGERPFKCDMCEKCFSKKDSLNAHIRSHTGDIPYKCNICLKSLSTKQNLNNHIRTHTSEKPSRSLYTQNRVRTEIKPYKCDVCDKCFVTKHNLNNHIRIIHIGEKSYRCDICDKSFGVKQSLITHKYLHTGDKPYKCELCEKCFTTKMNLKNHMYMHAVENPFKCELCNKCLTTKHNLKKHIRIVHTGERPFKCIICEKCFSNKDNLNTHIRLHTGEKPFVCEICKKRFRQQSDFKKHIRIHTGEKPYKCVECEKSFNTKKNLNKHVCIRQTSDLP